MTKTISAPMQTHLDGEVTSLSTCWGIRRRDETVILYTDHDQDIVISSFTTRHYFLNGTYGALSGPTRTAISSGEATIDNSEMEAILVVGKVELEDINAGLYDGAEIYVFQVNWDDLSDGIIKMPGSGTIGEITTQVRQGIFKAEMRGLSQFLAHRMGSLYSPFCRVDLFSYECKINESFFIQHGVVSGVTSKRQFEVDYTPVVFDDQPLTITNHSFEAVHGSAPPTDWIEGDVQAPGQWVITNTGSGGAEMTPETRVSLSAGPPAILYRQYATTGISWITVDFVDSNPDSIVMGLYETADFLDIGFLDGMTVVISNAEDGGNNGTFLINTVTSDTIVFDSAVAFTPRISDAIGMTSQPGSGSWINEGFEREMDISITGSASNDGTYHVGREVRALSVPYTMELDEGETLIDEDFSINLVIEAVGPCEGALDIEADKQTPHDLQRRFELYSQTSTISTGGTGEPTTADIDAGVTYLQVEVAMALTIDKTDTAFIGVIWQDGADAEIDRTWSPPLRYVQHNRLNQTYFTNQLRKFAILPGTRSVRILLGQQKNPPVDNTTCGVRMDNVRATVMAMEALELGLDRESVLLTDYFDGGVIKFLTGQNAGRAAEVDVYWENQGYTVPPVPLTMENTNPDKVTRSDGAEVDGSGNFLDDGFEDGMTLAIFGTASNDGTYLIDSVSATEIILDVGETLIAEAEQTDVTLSAGSERTLKTFLPLHYEPTVGDQFEIYPGCKKRLDEDCALKYDNSLNFRGEPYVPGQDEALKTPKQK